MPILGVVCIFAFGIIVLQWILIFAVTGIYAGIKSIKDLRDPASVRNLRKLFDEGDLNKFDELAGTVKAEIIFEDLWAEEAIG